MQRFGWLLAVGAILLSSCDSVPPAAPLDTASASAAPATDRFIVVLGSPVADADSEAVRLTGLHGGKVDGVFRHALKGYVAEMPEAVAAQLRKEQGVALVERDAPVHAAITQSNATWGIDRIDQRDLPLSGTYTYNASGAGVRVYVIDTGIRTTHGEFGGRAVGAFTSINDGNGTYDCDGHGTHVAGTIGGATYGVAKGVALYAVRVLDCSGNGTTSGVIAGIDWVTANAVKPAVANMSLGGGASAALDAAVQNSIATGITYSIAAGNSAADACNMSPARVGAALTVGATSATDARASFSNWGPCLDLFAPGVSITSAYNSSNTATASLSGTSMAAPHVAGAAALVLETQPAATPAAVAAALTSNATSGKVTGPGTGSPNLLLYTGFIGSPPPGPTVVLTIYAGNNQTGPVNQQLPGMLVVQLKDASGNPVGSAQVTFTVKTGGGTLVRYQDTTGPDGLGNTRWTLGPTVGAQTVEASATGAQPVTFTATATAPAPVLSIWAGNNQTGPVNTALPNPVTVRVTDGNGVALGGVVVTFGVSSGGGTVSPFQVTTGTNGQASAGWTLGATVGAQTVQASVAGATPVTFTATGTAPPGPTVVLTIYAGDNQTGPVNQQLPGMLAVQVKDAGGNPLGGVQVTFTVKTGGGTLVRYQDTTGPDGLGNTRWTLGPTVGAQTVEASVTGGLPVTFKATAT
jgi:subtilisin family serine protease